MMKVKRPDKGIVKFIYYQTSVSRSGNIKRAIIFPDGEPIKYRRIVKEYEIFDSPPLDVEIQENKFRSNDGVELNVALQFSIRPDFGTAKDEKSERKRIDRILNCRTAFWKRQGTDAKFPDVELLEKRPDKETETWLVTEIKNDVLAVLEAASFGELLSLANQNLDQRARKNIEPVGEEFSGTGEESADRSRLASGDETEDASVSQEENDVVPEIPDDFSLLDEEDTIDADAIESQTSFYGHDVSSIRDDMNEVLAQQLDNLGFKLQGMHDEKRNRNRTCWKVFLQFKKENELSHIFPLGHDDVDSGADELTVSDYILHEYYMSQQAMKNRLLTQRTNLDAMTKSLQGRLAQIKNQYTQIKEDIDLEVKRQEEIRNVNGDEISKLAALGKQELLESKKEEQEKQYHENRLGRLRDEKQRLEELLTAESQRDVANKSLEEARLNLARETAKQVAKEGIGMELALIESSKELAEEIQKLVDADPLFAGQASFKPISIAEYEEMREQYSKQMSEVSQAKATLEIARLNETFSESKRDSEFQRTTILQTYPLLKSAIEYHLQEDREENASKRRNELVRIFGQSLASIAGEWSSNIENVRVGSDSLGEVSELLRSLFKDISGVQNKRHGHSDEDDSSDFSVPSVILGDVGYSAVESTRSPEDDVDSKVPEKPISNTDENEEEDYPEE